MIAYFVAQPFGGLQSCGILLGGDNHLRLRHRLKHLIDAGNVFCLEVVVVGEGERYDLTAHRFQIENHLLR